ncbi:MAG: hypothetical protein ABII27_00760 [bacterium]
MVIYENYMKYQDFRNKFQNAPIIFSKNIILGQSKKQIIRNQLARWNKNGLLVELRRGAYLLNDNDRKVHVSNPYLANQLYSPSYISLEYALNFYGLIPERVNDVTSITTRKTLSFSNNTGNFSYRHVNPSVYRGFTSVNDKQGLSFLIADPEKALMDFCYLNLGLFSGNYKDIFLESYRLQNMESLNIKKILYYAELFNIKKLMKVADVLCGIICQERRSE